MVPTSARLTFSPVQRCLFAGHRLRVQMLLSSLNRRCQCRGLTVISRKTLNTGIRVGRVTSCDTGEDLGVKRSKVKEQGVTGNRLTSSWICLCRQITFILNSTLDTHAHTRTRTPDIV